MKVRIAFVTKPDGTVDTDRIGTIEDMPDVDAKKLIDAGVAVAATDQELADWDIDQQRRVDAEVEDLHALTKDELRAKFEAAANLPVNTKKDDLIAAVEEARRSETADAATDAGEAVDGAPVVTVLNDAESSPDVDPADREPQD